MLSDSEYSELATQAKRIGKPAETVFLAMFKVGESADTIRRRLIDMVAPLPGHQRCRTFADIDDDTLVRSLTHPQDVIR